MTQMEDDERCCGTGTCMINAQGVCWCGQVWDGQKMASPALAVAVAEAAANVAVPDPALQPAP